MMKLWILTVAALLSLAAAASAKSEAPVRLWGKASGGTAKIVVHFDRAVNDAVVTAWGVDGVKVAPTTLFSAATVAAGYETTLDVPYTVDASGSGYVAVSVRVGGGALASGKVRAFAVGVPATRSAGKTVRSKQQKIIEMPATVVK